MDALIDEITKTDYVSTLKMDQNEGNKYQADAEHIVPEAGSSNYSVEHDQTPVMTPSAEWLQKMVSSVAMMLKADLKWKREDSDSEDEAEDKHSVEEEATEAEVSEGEIQTDENS